MKEAEQARIDTAVGAIGRLLEGLPLTSLVLVRELVDEALRAARAPGAGRRQS